MGKEGKPTAPQGAPVARLDKWLWAARIFKTRSIAADACKNGRVMMSGTTVKPSRTIKAGEVVSVRKPPVTYSFKVLKCIEQRVGAKLLPEIYENVTDPKQYEILEMSRISGFVDRARGTGRPTKKDRRAMEAFVDPAMFGFDELDDDFEGFDDDDFNS
ncbi:MAG: RNA-binding S4 domain-containing protein [Prevotella sp.]|nr:RNA-binding S4 domain-containing protein [Prevotella sp.]MBR6138451.1 RNA-binding S4 domain-containing protein [Prevotella sp.]